MSGQHVVVMGVSGSGKSTVGEALAQRLGWTFAEADQFHPAANIAKMTAGTPLTDEDRWPWLRALGGWMHEHGTKGESTIITCSALRRVYRDLLRECADGVFFVHLDGPRSVLAQRMGGRRGHFMPPELLDSQLATLEPLQADEAGVRLDITRSPKAVIAAAEAALPATIA